MVSYFKAEKVNDRITCIRSLSGELMYLIEGKDRALLVDTCLGCGSLRSFVEELTGKPLIVVLSHGHIDHAMGAPEFDRVYMNRKDIPVYLGMNDIQGRKGYIQGNVAPEVFAQITDADFIPAAEMEFEALDDGKVFELGGIHVEAYGLPGHTKGTMVFYIPEERILILGDACNTFTFMFSGDISIEEYREELAKMRDRMAGKAERVFLCHHMMEAKPSIMDEVIEVCDDIMAGKADDIPFDFMGQQAYIAKAVQPGQPREDGKWGNVVYSKEYIWKKQQMNGGMEMKEVYDFLKKCETYYLATAEGDQPRVRPFGTIDIFEGKMYIQTGKCKDVSKQLQTNPKAEICAFGDGVWLRIACQLIRDENVKAKEHMLEAYPSLKASYSAYDDNTEVLYLEDASATFYSFGGEPRTVKF